MLVWLNGLGSRLQIYFTGVRFPPPTLILFKMKGSVITIKNEGEWVTTWTYTEGEWVGRNDDGSKVRGITLKEIINLYKF
jgi:hypothetical protein